MHFSINCSTVICSPTVILMLSWKKPLVKPMAPGSIFYHISFRSIFICNLYFPIYIIKIPKIFILSYYLYQISLSQVAMKGLTTPLSRWVQVFDCLCRCIDWRLVHTSYWIDTLVLKLREILISTLLHHPFLFKGKTNASSRSNRKNFWLRCRGDLRQIETRLPSTCQFVALLPGRSMPSQDIPSAHHKFSSLALHYSPFTSCFPFP